MAQFARPINDVTAGNWSPSTGADLYAMLDETTANDADYVELAGAASFPKTFSVTLGSVSDPGVNSDHVIRVRARKVLTGGDQRQITLTLIQNINSSSSVIDSQGFNLTDDDLVTQFTWNLSTVAAGNITNYGDLGITVEGDILTNNSTPRDTQVTWLELEIPDAGSGDGLHRLINGNLVNFGLLNNGLIT